MFNNDKRIRALEEEIAYLHKDIANLCNIVEAIQRPEEIHYHYTNIINTKPLDENSQGTDINDFFKE
jgi:hypothetical protein